MAEETNSPEGSEKSAENTPAPTETTQTVVANVGGGGGGGNAAPPAAVAAVASAAQENPDALQKLIQMYEEDRQANKAEIAGLREELGLTRQEVADFFKWAKEDPSQAAVTMVPPPVAQVNTDPNAQPPAGENQEGNKQPVVEEKKGWKKFW